VRELGLPIVLAGEAVSKAPSREEVEAFSPLGGLHAYQKQIQKRVLRSLRRKDNEKRRGVIWLPTGTGKTRVAVETFLLHCKLELPTNCILWIADREELCEQAASTFRHVWMQAGYRRKKIHGGASPPPLQIMRLWSNHSFSDPPLTPTVIIASIQKLYAGLEEEEFREFLDTLGRLCEVVVLDEAHKSQATSYLQVLRALGLSSRNNEYDRNHRTGPALFGLTATPVRTNIKENRQLRRRFADRLIEPDPGYRTLHAFVKGEYLSRAAHKSIKTGYRLTINDGKERQHWDTFGEFSRGVINRAGQDPKRTAQIVEDLERRLKKFQSILVFACSVDHARAIAEVLSRLGIKARSLDGKTPKNVRHATIDAFRKREFQVLVNCDLLATGFDAPNVDCVAIARPVSSKVLYAQMVGRGLRGPKNGGTSNCLILDYEDSAGDYRNLDALRRKFRSVWKDSR
jgi:superfamily II DNA or RNA helicase